MTSVVTELMPVIRKNLNISRIPSKDGDVIEPIDISSYFNMSKNASPFNIKFKSLIDGGTEKNGVIFNMGSKGKDEGKSIIATGSKGIGENPFPSKIEGITVNEDVSSLIFLHACALPAENQKAYFNIPDFFDTADLLGWYEIIYEDGFKSIIPIQYGVNILEWNPGSEERLDRREGETGSPQNVYCYQADPVTCSTDPAGNPITFYSFEWVNPRFGKKISKINIYGTENYQGTQTNYGKPEYKPIRSNAILLAGISKVQKRNPFKPE